MKPFLEKDAGSTEDVPEIVQESPPENPVVHAPSVVVSKAGGFILRKGMMQKSGTRLPGLAPTILKTTTVIVEPRLSTSTNTKAKSISTSNLASVLWLVSTTSKHHQGVSQIHWKWLALERLKKSTKKT